MKDKEYNKYVTLKKKTDGIYYKLSKLQKKYYFGYSNVVSVPSSVKVGMNAEVKLASPYLEDYFGTHDDIVDEFGYWRAIATRDDMNKRIGNYIDADPIFATNRVGNKARNLVSKLVKSYVGKGLKPLSISKAVRSCPQSSSAGDPFSRMGIWKKRQASRLVVKRIKYISSLEGKSYTPPFSRAAARCPINKNTENKPRLVWNYPFEIIAMESRFFHPFFDKIKTCENFAWRINWLAGDSGDFASNFLRKRGASLGFDWSRFDAEINPLDLRWAFSLIKSCFTMNPVEKRQFEIIENYFITTPLLFYDRAYLVHGGIPSGSYFTQIIGSILNLYYNTYICLKLCTERTFVELSAIKSLDDFIHFICVLGDDSVLKLKYELYYSDFEYIAYIAREELGKTIHPAKGFFTPHSRYPKKLEFLSRKIPSPHVVEVDCNLAMAQICIPEMYDTCPGDLKTRLIGVKWMSGTNWYLHFCIDRLWHYLDDEYPDDDPTPFRRDLKDIFKFLFNIETPSLVYPDSSEIISRYRTK
jgi:hypothetical protein